MTVKVVVTTRVVPCYGDTHTPLLTHSRLWAIWYCNQTKIAQILEQQMLMRGHRHNGHDIITKDGSLSLVWETHNNASNQPNEMTLPRTRTRQNHLWNEYETTKRETVKSVDWLQRNGWRKRANQVAVKQTAQSNKQTSQCTPIYQLIYHSRITLTIETNQERTNSSGYTGKAELDRANKDLCWQSYWEPGKNSCTPQ